MSLANLPYAVRLKIERAEHHIREFERQVEIYGRETGPTFLIRQREKGSNAGDVFVEAEHPLTPSFSLIIGDVAHNLRAALDHLMWSLVGTKADRPEAVQFPFVRKVESLEKAIAHRQIDLAGVAVVAAIKALQPYEGGDPLLWGLHAVNIADKHRLIIMASGHAVFSPAHLLAILSDSGSSERGINTLNYGAASDGNWADSYKPKVTPTFDVQFGEGEPFQGKSVAQTLRAVSTRVAEAADLIVSASQITRP